MKYNNMWWWEMYRNVGRCKLWKRLVIGTEQCETHVWCRTVYLHSGNNMERCAVGCTRRCTCNGQLKCDGTRAETRIRLSAKRTSPFKSAGGRQFSRLLAAEVCASAVVMLDTPCSEVVWRVLATHYIRQFPLHFSSRASQCAITFQLDSTS